MSDQPHLEHANGWAAYENAEQFLEMDGWHPQAVDGTTAYTSRFVGANGESRVVTQVNVEREHLYVYAFLTVAIPEERRAAVAELVTLANYNMPIGNFELDYGDGEVRYKVSVNFTDETLTSSLLRNCVYAAPVTLDRYMPALLAVGFGTTDPRDAVAAVEGGIPPA